MTKISLFLEFFILFAFLCSRASFPNDKKDNKKIQLTSLKENFTLPYTDITITIFYDNHDFDTNLKPAWGFSCLIEGTDKTILFDTGGDGQILLSNMQKLGIDPNKIEIVVLSHIHGDHTEGLDSFLAHNPGVEVYLPASFSQSFKQKIKKIGAKIVEVKDSIKICSNVYSTGEMGKWIKEQSLLIKIKKGLIVITGCAHPGIVNIIKRAKEITQDSVYLVLGGFHLSGVRSYQIKKIIQEFEREGVKKVAPCHCSGDLTCKLFQDIYKKNFILAGVGKKIKIDS